MSTMQRHSCAATAPPCGPRRRRRPRPTPGGLSRSTTGEPPTSTGMRLGSVPALLLGVGGDRVEAPRERDPVAEHHVNVVGGRVLVHAVRRVPDAHAPPEHERVGAVRRAKQELAHVRPRAVQPQVQPARRRHRRRVAVGLVEQVAQRFEGRLAGQVRAQQPEAVLGQRHARHGRVGPGVGQLEEVGALDPAAESLERQPRRVDGLRPLGDRQVAARGGEIGVVAGLGGDQRLGTGCHDGLRAFGVDVVVGRSRHRDRDGSCRGRPRPRCPPAGSRAAGQPTAGPSTGRCARAGSPLTRGVQLLLVRPARAGPTAGRPTRLGSLGASTEITALGILVRMPASVAFIWASPPASVPTMMSALIPSAASRLSEATWYAQVGQRPSRT